MFQKQMSEDGGAKASPQKGQPAKRLRVYPRLSGAATGSKPSPDLANPKSDGKTTEL
jgi:hypothetical protein